MKKEFTIPLTKSEEGDGKEWELIIEGYASTPDPDRVNDIVLPTAFGKTMQTFMENPVMMFNHQSDWTIGKILEYKIDSDGLWVKGAIAPTSRGKDVATLIKYDIVKSFSFMYDVLDYEQGDEKTPNIIKEVEAYEIGVVSIPANTQALIETAKAKGFKLNTIPERINIVDNKEIEKKVDATDVKVSEVESNVAEVIKLQKTMQDALADGTKTNADLKEFTDKIAGEFKDAQDALSKEIDKIKRQKTVSQGVDLGGMSVKSLMKKAPDEIRYYFGDDSASTTKLLRLQKSADDLFMCDALMAAGNSDYNRLPKETRMKTLGLYQEFNEFGKAMDIATATEGAEWIPTGFSGRMEELVRVELKVAGLFEEIPMPTSPYTSPIEGADTDAQLIGEKTTVATGWDSDEETPTTKNMTLTAVKARSRIQTSGELTEQSAIPIINYTQNKGTRGIARFYDNAIVNGQPTGTFDSGYTIGAKEAKKAWDGLRYHYQNNITSTYGIDLSTFNEDNLRSVRGNMGTHGLYPSDLVTLLSVKTYLMKMLKLDSVLTVDKYGPNAVILTGELAKFDNVPQIITEFCKDDLNADGIYDGTTTDRSELLTVYKDGWVIGKYRNMTVEIVRDAINDIYTVVVFKRGDFKPFVTPASTNIIVNSGYNITF